MTLIDHVNNHEGVWLWLVDVIKRLRVQFGNNWTSNFVSCNFPSPSGRGKLKAQNYEFHFQIPRVNAWLRANRMNLPLTDFTKFYFKEEIKLLKLLSSFLILIEWLMLISYITLFIGSNLIGYNCRFSNKTITKSFVFLRLFLWYF